MQQKAFAQFPAMAGGYQYLDIFTIEAIGQGLAKQAATIFIMGSERYYNVEISDEELAASGEPDAASWCLTLVSEVARRGGAPLMQADQSDESDYEDFGPR